MHGSTVGPWPGLWPPTCIFGAKLTPFSLQRALAAGGLAAADRVLAGFDEGTLSFSLPILVYMDNPYRHNTTNISDE